MYQNKTLWGGKKFSSMALPKIMVTKSQQLITNRAEERSIYSTGVFSHGWIGRKKGKNRGDTYMTWEWCKARDNRKALIKEKDAQKRFTKRKDLRLCTDERYERYSNVPCKWLYVVWIQKMTHFHSTKSKSKLSF